MIETDGPFYHVTGAVFEFTIPRWGGHHPSSMHEADAEIKLPERVTLLLLAG